MAERLQRLQALILDQQTAFNRSKVGTTMDVLLEKQGRRPGQLMGRSPFLQAVQVDADPSRIGSILSVDIDTLGSNSLFGRLTHRASMEAAS